MFHEYYIFASLVENSTCVTYTSVYNVKDIVQLLIVKCYGGQLAEKEWIFKNNWAFKTLIDLEDERSD